MSAIFGLINLDGRPAERRDLDLMGAALAAHGPDGNYVWVDGPVGLGQRLMRFTPEDCLDLQLVADATGQRVLVADARIDNRPELREELGILPAEACELSDAQFILRAYDKWGDDCARHLIGAFAFALCDLREQRVLIARSPMGERSLFYYETPRLFAFASAPKGLFALPFVPREVNRQSMADFVLVQSHQPGSSFFSGVNRLQAGHMIVVRGGGFKSREYRALDVQREIRFPRDSDYVAAFNTLLDRVIADQLRSLTPVGVSLSGGLDSTAIAASAALTLRQEGKRLHSFTEVPGPDFNGAVIPGWYADETPFIKAMARRYDNLDVHFLRSDGRSYLDEPDSFVDSFFDAAEAPMLSVLHWPWVRAIQQEARARNVRILFTGNPGNLTVSWDGQGLLPQLLRKLKWRRALREARALAPHNTVWSMMGTLGRSGLVPLLPNPLWLAAKQLRSGRIPGLSTASFCGSLAPIRLEFARAERVGDRLLDSASDLRRAPPLAARALALQRRANLRADAVRGGEVLFDVQKRDPTADIRLVEFCFSIPEEQYLHDGQSRRLIRSAGADRLPREVLENKGRGLQFSDWFGSMSRAGSRIAEELARLERSALASEIIDLGRLRRILERTRKARSDRPPDLVDFRYLLDQGIAAGRFLVWLEAGL